MKIDKNDIIVHNTFKLTIYDFDTDPLRVIFSPDLHGVREFRHKLAVIVNNKNLSIPTLLRHFWGV